MKNKETIIGWILIALLMVGLIFYQQNKMKEEQELKKSAAKTQKTEKVKTVADSAAVSVADSIQTAPSVANADSQTLPPVSEGPFAQHFTGEEQLIVLENDVQKVTLTNKGGQIKSVELKEYKTWDGKPLILFTDKTNSLSYIFPIEGDKVINTAELYFTTDGVKNIEKGKQSVSFKAFAGEGKYFEQTYSLGKDGYLFDYEVATKGLESVVPSNNTFISVEWKNTLSTLEKTIDLERRYSALYFRYKDSDVNHLDEDNEKDEVSFETPVEWISYKQQFFNTTLFSNGLFNKGKLESNFNKNETAYVKKYNANFTLPYTSVKDNSYKLQYYVGPNHYYTLAAIEREVQDIIKLGPNFWMFSWIKYITRFIIWVFSWFNNLHLNYGIIILIMTLMLKVALHPLTAKSIESAAKMKILAPELTVLREKYAEDQARLGQEQMKLYSRAGVSPLGGCLPLLLQMPILMAMYYFFPASIELRQEPFLWAHDLSSYDAIVTWATPVFGFTHISLFTILMTITSVIQAVMNNQMNAMGNQQPGMKYIPYIMPVMLMFIFNSFPAALTYYYLLQNMLGVGHQWIIQKFVIKEDKLRAQIEENKKNPKPKSGWAKKLEDMQREAANRQRNRK